LHVADGAGRHFFGFAVFGDRENILYIALYPQVFAGKAVDIGVIGRVIIRVRRPVGQINRVRRERRVFQVNKVFRFKGIDGAGGVLVSVGGVGVFNSRLVHVVGEGEYKLLGLVFGVIPCGDNNIVFSGRGEQCLGYGVCAVKQDIVGGQRHRRQRGYRERRRKRGVKRIRGADLIVRPTRGRAGGVENNFRLFNARCRILYTQFYFFQVGVVRRHGKGKHRLILVSDIAVHDVGIDSGSADRYRGPGLFRVNPESDHKTIRFRDFLSRLIGGCQHYGVYAVV